MLTCDDIVVRSRSFIQDIKASGSSKKIFFIVLLTVVFAFIGIGIRRTWSVNIFFIQSNVDDLTVLPAAGSGQAGEQTWNRKTVFQVFDSFRPRTLDTCADSCDVNDTSSSCSSVSYEDWNKVLSSHKMKYSPFLTGNQYIFEFEKEHLSYPPLSDSKELPDLKLSTVVIEDVQDGVVSCNVNATVSGRVYLIDGYGKQRTSGGDEVRVWVVNEFNFRASGYVIDLRNGSYQIFVRCLWPGTAKIHIAVAYPREFIRATIHQTHVGMARFLIGRFEKNGFEEHTICWSAPNIPGRLCVCNYTTFNQQSFYCGRPLDTRLTCDDWKATKPSTLPPPDNVTTEEMKLIMSIPTKDIKQYTIRHNLTLLVNNSGQLPHLSPCSSISPEVTWDIDYRPQGYWSPDNIWTSLICKRQDWNIFWTVSCLQNTTIHVIGDSNGVRLYNELRAASQCVTSMRGGWPEKEICTNFKKGITVVFSPHEYPLYLGAPWRDKLLYGGVAKQIDAMPSKGRVVVIVHYFLHVMVSHLAVTRVRLEALRDAIDRLLKRNPDAMAAFRGPHVSSLEWDYNHTIGGDVLGMIYMSMLKEIFSNLKDKVVFLDGWDMTSSIENSDYHPTNNVPHEMIRTLLSFRCTENVVSLCFSEPFKMLSQHETLVGSQSLLPLQGIRFSATLMKIIFVVLLTSVLIFIGIGLIRPWSMFIFTQPNVNVLNFVPGPGQAGEQTWNRKTVFQVFDSFRPRTLDTCVDSCDVNDTSSACSSVSYEDWNKVLSSQKMKYSPFLTGNQYIFDFEKEHLSYPPLSDSKELPDLKLSTVVIEDVQDGVVSCNVNATVSGRVDLIDGYGKQRTSGGDEVRVWVVNEFNFRASGYVIDLRNGSYQIFVRCLWPGAAKIHIAVAYPREFIRATIHQTHVGMARFLLGRFEKNGTEEHTICWSAPNIPGRLCVCNYTTFNQQSFYCGRPLDTRLTCDDWKATKPSILPPPYNVTTEEMKLIMSIPTEDIKQYTIRHNLTLLVNNSGQLPHLSPCSSMSPEVTWDVDYRPQGYWSPDNIWTSLICKRQDLNLNWTVSCLQNTTIHVIGDSNGVRLYNQLRAASQCVTSQPNSWPEQEICTNFENSITIVFTPHEYPLYLGAPWKDKLLYGGVAKQIDAMPSKGRVVVVVHYFLHVIVSHLAVTRVRLEALRDAIDRLLKRNPDAMAAFRGPHVSSSQWDYNHTIGGDVLGVIYMSMLKEIFGTLKDKVVFLDGWDMTSSIENSEFHPTNNVTYEMIRTLLSFRCTENGNVEPFKI